MLILGSWAVGNMIWGGIGASQSMGENKAFHQMNLYWNSVNLIIAGLGYWQATKESPGTDLWQTMDAQNGIEKILEFGKVRRLPITKLHLPSPMTHTLDGVFMLFNKSKVKICLIVSALICLFDLSKTIL